LSEKKRGKLWTALNRERQESPPVWLMRQAGRYLPEYREARARAGSFWDLCMNPRAAADVSMQPVRRFGLDAAIVFSDILVVPYALGKKVAFEDGSGPRLEPTESADELRRDPEEWVQRLAPVYDAIGLVSGQVGADTDLIGFAGGPWTLATYMAQGEGSSDQRAAKLWGYRDPVGFARLLEVIADCVARHLCAQAEAGASVLQIFDSWASGLPERAFAEWVIAPTKRVIDQVRLRCEDAKIIGFPRGATQDAYERYVNKTGVDGVSLDTAAPMRWAAETLTPAAAIQGNLDPVLLLAGGPAQNEAVEHLLQATGSVPFIANLGHGVLPETPLEHVAKFVAQVRSAR
jgi:uroporphyrinogen decarboxylase